MGTFQENENTSEDNPLMKDSIHTAESFTKNFADWGNFDFSIESLQLVDDLLDEMSDYVSDKEDLLYNTYTMVGSYVFEVVRRKFGGKYYWERKEEQPLLVVGEPDFSVCFRAWEKVKGRLVNGAEDSIPFYVDGIIEHIEKGKQQQEYYWVTVI